MAKNLWLWNLRLKVRKWTSPFHILCGLLIAALIHFYPLGAVLLFTGIAFLEYWQWKDIGDTGVADFWEIYVGTCIGAVILVILKIVGVL